jgi:hypothetical protein
MVERKKPALILTFSPGEKESLFPRRSQIARQDGAIGFLDATNSMVAPTYSKDFEGQRRVDAWQREDVL